MLAIDMHYLYCANLVFGMRNPTARLPASNKHSFHYIISSHSPGLLLPGTQLVLLDDFVAWGAWLV